MPTDAEINKVLAEKCMGWKVSSDLDRCYIDSTHNRFACFVYDWNPLTDIAQAMMCAEKIFSYFHLNYYAHSTDPRKFTLSGWCRRQITSDWYDTPAEAIARACYEAVKEEGWNC